MYWTSFSEFLAMGNHGVYVWGSVIVMAIAMIVPLACYLVVGAYAFWGSKLGLDRPQDEGRHVEEAL